MKLRIGTSAAALFMLTALAVGALAQKPEYRISKGYTHKNLTIFPAQKARHTSGHRKRRRFAP